MIKIFRRTFGVLILLTAVCLKLSAFTLHPDSTQIKGIYHSDSNSFFFNFHNQNFFWNNEYFGTIAGGYTLVGYNATPTLEYHFSENFKIRAGVHMLKYSGIDDFSTLMPSYSAIIHKNKMSFIIGTIYGGMYHKLPDVVHAFERNFTHNQENGFQFRLDRDRIFLDVWFDWQEFIFHGDDKQEEFVAGFSADPVLLKSNSFSLSTPTFFMVNHKGGQINIVEEKITSTYNIGFGLKGDYKLGNGFFNSISAQSQVIGFATEGPEAVETDTISPFHLYYIKVQEEFSIKDEGYGIYSSLKLSRGNSFISLGHWHAENFVSIVGNNIYHSLSSTEFYGNVPVRDLITTQIYYSKELVNFVDIGVMAEAMYDTRTALTDYSMGVKVCINASYGLKKIGKARNKK